MTDKSTEETVSDAMSAFSGEMGKLAAGYQQAMTQWMNAWGANSNGDASTGMSENGKSNGAEANASAPSFDSAKVLENQTELMREYQELWVATTQRMMNRQADTNEPDSRRQVVPESPRSMGDISNSAQAHSDGRSRRQLGRASSCTSIRVKRLR